MYLHHKVDHEFPSVGLPRISYLVCSTPRSGSSLLCELLCHTELAGAPTEYLDTRVEADFRAVWRFDSLEEYCRLLLLKKTTPNGVFGFKAHFHQLAERLSTAAELKSVFPGLQYVSIQRRDTLRQAVSLAKALQTDCWASHQTDVQAAPRYDRVLIHSQLQNIFRERYAWESFYRVEGIQPIRVDYDALVAAPRDTVSRVLGELQIEPPSELTLEAPTLQRQSDSVNEEWCRRYTESERTRL
ncbi:MAG: Stf0 family sulfotransferase [Planctomycetota bacterium]